MPRRQAQIAADKVVATQVFADTLSAVSIVGDSVSVAAAVTLDSTYSGKTIYIDQTSAYTITLPPVAQANGFVYHFVAVDAGANIVVIDADGAEAILIGTLVDGAGTSASATAGTGIDFEVLAAPGDWAELRSNGTNWFASGNCDAAGGILFS